MENSNGLNLVLGTEKAQEFHGHLNFLGQKSPLNSIPVLFLT